MRFHITTILLFLILLLDLQKSQAQISTIKAIITDQKGNPWKGNYVLSDSSGNIIRTGGFIGSINITGLNSTGINGTGLQETGFTHSSVQDYSRRNTGINNTRAINNGVNTSSAQDSSRRNAGVNKNSVKDSRRKNAGINNTREVNTGVNESSVQDSSRRNAVVSNTSEINTGVNENSVQDSSIRNAGANSTSATGVNKNSINSTSISHSRLNLKLNFLYFADTTITIRYRGKDLIDVGRIIPIESTTTLAEVGITSAPAQVRYNNSGNLEVNVAGTILASSSSVNEILSRTPGIIINEGIISLQGKGEVIIYLNGTTVPAERLASIPTSQITKIEIISNPSARYEAAGRAVINITTKTPSGDEFSGSLAQHFTYSDFFGINTNTFAEGSYSKGKLVVSANLAMLQGKGRELLYTTRVRDEQADYLNSELTTDWQRNFLLYTTYGAGIRYNFSARTGMGISFSGNRDRLGGTVESDNTIATLATTTRYGSNIARDELRNNNAFIADFNTVTDTLGSSYFFTGQYARYQTDYDDKIDEFGGSIPRFLKNTFVQDLNITSFQADRTRFFSKTTKLEAGIRYSHTDNSSLTQFETSVSKSGPYIPEPEISSSFSYEESISAAYTTLSGKAGILQFGLGARAEWTKYALATSAGDGQDFKKDYFYLFPNLQLELPVGKKNKLRFTYASRISRPRYQALNPFVIYQDPFTTIEGNPNLLPEKSHALELSANISKTAIKLAYTYTNDQLSGAALRGSTPESYVLKSINISSDQSYLLSVTQPVTIGKRWQTINTVSLAYGKSSDNVYAFAEGKTRPQLYLYSSNTFSLEHGFKLQLLAWYLGDRYYTLRHDETRSNITAGIEKSLLQNKLKVTFTANDIFNHTASVGDYNVGKTQIYYNRHYGNNHFKLTASYNFGSNDKTTTQTRAVQPENSRAN